MIFEGSEKKLEIIFAPTVTDIRLKGDQFWETVVEKSRAKILSKCSNERLDAYLLSESSLFVWENRILMITCGTTTLINAAEFLIGEFGQDNIDLIFFQRKNEYVGPMQKSSFFDDVEKLKELIDGSAYRFGKYDGHHTFVFNSNKEYRPDDDDNTTELLFYGISKEANAIFQKENQSAQVIRDFLKLETYFPGFKLDDYVFDPYGYSINAIKDDYYFTIHITPQECSSYISFETDLPTDKLNKESLENFIRILAPGSFDVVTHHPHDYIPTEFNNYEKVSQVRGDFNCGFKSEFTHYYRKENIIDSPYKYF